MKKFLKELIPYIVIIAVVLLIRTFVITPVRVDGQSMMPTLENGELLILKKFDHSYNRFDIVVFNHNGDKLIKRIIGLPGETVEFRDNKLYIDGKEMEEPFVRKETDDFIYENIEEGTYFVLGDNRTNSLDSRYIGVVEKKDLDGVVDLSIIPFKKVK